MAHIRNFGLIAQLKSEASNHVIRYKNGVAKQSGRGLSFWFMPQVSSVVEVPMDDRELTLFVRGRSKDFQAITVQGTIEWRAFDPALLADRVDFTLDLVMGKHKREPIEAVEARLAALANQIMIPLLSKQTVRELLDAGPAPLRQKLDETLIVDPILNDSGIQIIAVRLSSLAPSSELERALQTPTFESLQEKADEAMFQRRALAVEKERTIAENELATKVELARREKQLIAEEAENARNRASGLAEANGIDANSEADRIRLIESAKVDAEDHRVAIYRDLAPSVLLGLAAQELAGKLDTIHQVNVTPDLLASVLTEMRKPIVGRI